MGAPLGYGPEFSNNIFEKVNPQVLACNRHQALILAGRLRALAGGYLAGQVLARNSVDGLLDKYVSGGASGTGTAVGVLFASTTDAPSGANVLVPVIYGGKVRESKLIGLDSGAVTALKGREIVTLLGETILSF